MSLDDILLNASKYNCPYVCVTGGEPLAQPGCFDLLNKLCESGYKVSLETSGARDISQVDSRVMVVMDIKTPGSQEVDKNLIDNINFLKSTDQIKFVLCSKADYLWACDFIVEHNLMDTCCILFSPSWNELDATALANWIIEDRLNVRYQLQLHKILWNDTPGH